MYKQLQPKTYPALRQRQVIKSPEVLNKPASQNEYTTNKSYADAVRGKPNSLEETPTNIIVNQQLTDMADLKSMMTKFMKQMSNMMTLLTTIVSKLV